MGIEVKGMAQNETARDVAGLHASGYRRISYMMAVTCTFTSKAKRGGGGCCVL
jgi:hypothetical protein